MNSVKLCVVVIISFKVHYINTIQSENARVTPDVYSRAEILKQMIRDEIRQDQEAFLERMMDTEIEGSLNIGNDYEILHKNDERITPIMNTDRSNHIKKHKKATATTTATIPVARTTKKSSEPFNFKPLRTGTNKNKKSLVRKRKPAEIFYRRELDHRLNYPVKEVQCLDLLTPYLMGEKGNGTFKIIRSTDQIVLRVIQLISEDTSTNTKDEIYSLLYQISTINMRLYQWDEKAMRLLFNQIIQGKTQTFRTLKGGIKKLLDRWHMDYGNATNLLRQTRLFRPPCIQTSELEGSTRSSKITRFTKSTTPKRTCPPTDDDCY